MTQVVDTPAAPPSGQPEARPAASPSAEDVGKNWINGVLGRTPVDLPSALPADPAEQTEPQGTQKQGAAPAEPTPLEAIAPGTPDAQGTDSGASSEEPVSLTRSQIQQMLQDGIEQFKQTELPRLTQAEADRREDRRKKAEERARLKELPDKDPYAAASALKDMLNNEDEIATTHAMRMQIYGGALDQFDAAVLDPITSALPKAEATKLIQRGINTIEDRTKYVTDGLKIYRAEAIKEGAALERERLKKDPAFRKEVLAEARAGGGVAEPETIMGTPTDGGPRDPNTTMNTLIRRRMLGR